MIELTKSNIICWLECPFKFKRYVIDGLKMEKNIYMIRGSIFHDMVGRFWSEIRFDNGNMVMPILSYNDRWIRVMLENFIGLMKKRWEMVGHDRNKFFPYKVEEKFVTITEIGGEHVKLTGIVDCIDKSDDEFFIIEWKSGKNKKHHLYELAYYKYLLGLKGIDVNRGVIFYPYKNSIEVFNITDDIVNEVKGIMKCIVFCIKNNLWWHTDECDRSEMNEVSVANGI